MLMPEIRRAVRIADDDAAITMLSTVEDLLTASVAERDFNTQLFATFAVAGLLVALVGIYGLVAFLVARGTRDMGIRLALGANGRRLELSVMAGTLRWVAAGLGVGMGVTLLCTQLLEALRGRGPGERSGDAVDGGRPFSRRRRNRHLHSRQTRSACGPDDGAASRIERQDVKKFQNPRPPCEIAHSGRAGHGANSTSASELPDSPVVKPGDHENR